MMAIASRCDGRSASPRWSASRPLFKDNLAAKVTNHEAIAAATPAAAAGRSIATRARKSIGRCARQKFTAGVSRVRLRSRGRG